LLKEEEILLARNVGATWIGFFLTIQPQSSKVKYGKRYQELVDQIEPSIRLAHDLGLKVRFTCEDASRTPLNQLLPFYEYVSKRGVDMLGYADTTGTLLPFRARRIFRKLRKNFPRIPLHFHGHNDRGVALANGIEALAAGWDSIDASLLGLGERGGIIPLTEAALVLQEEWGKPLDLKQLPALEQLVWKDVNVEHYHRRRFAHKAGLHCLSALQHPETYESVPIEKFGEERIGVLSKFSGIRSILAIAQSIGVPLSRDKAVQISQSIQSTEKEIWRKEDLKKFFSAYQ
jgi:isopropylmalate/homocitrate/citramalate synthase